MVRELDLVGGEVVAIDGAFFDGNASKASIKTQRRIAKRLAEIEQEIEAYGAVLEANDSAEAERPPAGREGDGRDGGGDIAQKVAALMAKRATCRPIWRGWKRVARRNCREPMRMPGCCRRTVRWWRATTFRSPSTINTS